MEEGEYVAIMGPSGSGKTTLMNIIGCLDKQTEGTFFLDGVDIKACSENEMSDLRLNKIGFVFQSFHLLPKQSALANVEMPLNYARVPKKERRERALKALDRVGLADRVDFKPNQLSGGQMQSRSDWNAWRSVPGLRSSMPGFPRTDFRLSADPLRKC